MQRGHPGLLARLQPQVADALQCLLVGVGFGEENGETAARGGGSQPWLLPCAQCMVMRLVVPAVGTKQLMACGVGAGKALPSLGSVFLPWSLPSPKIPIPPQGLPDSLGSPFHLGIPIPSGVFIPFDVYIPSMFPIPPYGPCPDMASPSPLGPSSSFRSLFFFGVPSLPGAPSLPRIPILPQGPHPFPGSPSSPQGPCPSMATPCFLGPLSILQAPVPLWGPNLPGTPSSHRVSIPSLGPHPSWPSQTLPDVPSLSRVSLTLCGPHLPWGLHPSWCPHPLWCPHSPSGPCPSTLSLLGPTSFLLVPVPPWCLILAPNPHPSPRSPHHVLVPMSTLASSKSVRPVRGSACCSRRPKSFGVRTAGAKKRRKRNPLMAKYCTSCTRTELSTQRCAALPAPQGPPPRAAVRGSAPPPACGAA